MLRRGALVLFLLVASGIAALFAANHAGITWPWQRETTAETPVSERAPETASQQREEKAAPDENGATPAGKDAAPSPETARQEAEKAIEQTTAALSPSAAPPSEPGPDSVDIDISRISGDGASVFAGRAEPNKYVTVLENGKPAGTVQADANGEWSLSTEHKFASTDPKLTYEVSDAPPPAPEPPAPEPKVAEAPAASPSNSAASEAMKKFEDMVAEAREEAKKEEEAKQSQGATASSQPAETSKPDAETKTADATPSAPAEKPAEQSTAGTPVTKQPEPDKPATADAPRESREAAAASSTEAASASSGSAVSGSASSSGSSSGSSSSAAAKADTTVAAAATTGAAAQKSAPIPVPIMFVYNEATLTPDGERAAKLLLEYLTLKRYSAIELTGHADERGTYEYNMDLSRERLNAVASRLKDGGYAGDLTLVPKGKSEPYAGVDRKRYTGEALFQLDRRVELRIAR